MSQMESFFTSSADDYSMEYYRALAVVESNGLVFWSPPTKFRSTCPVGAFILIGPQSDHWLPLSLSLTWRSNFGKVELNPRVRCAFGNVSIIGPDLCNASVYPCHSLINFFWDLIDVTLALKDVNLKVFLIMQRKPHHRFHGNHEMCET